MRKLEMKYFNTYYFCSIIQYIIEDSSLDYARTLAEFTDPLSECERMERMPADRLLSGSSAGLSSLMSSFQI